MRSDEKLILFGGGPMPTEGVDRFLHWSERFGKKRVLVVAWASEEALLTADAVVARLKIVRNVADYSLHPPVSARERKYFIDQLGDASAVFFSGGNQNRILDVVADPNIRNALQSAYASGMPFGGTSAGTAIMSPVSIGGDIDSTILGTSSYLREGLGLLPGTIVDQHFLKRQRQNRLFGLALEHPDKLCIGIDENVALAVNGNRHAEVLGESKVMIVMEQGRGSLGVNILNPGELYDLKLRLRKNAMPRVYAASLGIAF